MWIRVGQFEALALREWVMASEILWECVSGSLVGRRRGVCSERVAESVRSDRLESRGREQREWCATCGYEVWQLVAACIVCFCHTRTQIQHVQRYKAGNANTTSKPQQSAISQNPCISHLLIDMSPLYQQRIYL